MMRRSFLLSLVLLSLVLATATLLAARAHTVAFGKWLPVKLFVGAAEEKTQPMQVRALYVDGELREFTTGEPHPVTDRVFVVRRAYRVSDLLPDEPKKVPNWKWQRGGWLMVARSTGRVTQLALPDFDPYYSAASWYRDYVAYCGLSDDAERVYAVVAQLGRKKPLLRKDLGAARGEELPDSECPPPRWQRGPVRVTFAPADKAPATFEVRGRWAELAEEPQPVPSEERSE